MIEFKDRKINQLYYYEEQRLIVICNKKPTKPRFDSKGIIDYSDNEDYHNQLYCSCVPVSFISKTQYKKLNTLYDVNWKYLSTIDNFYFRTDEEKFFFFNYLFNKD